MSARDPTRLDPTTVDEAEVVPSLPQLASVIPRASLRHLISQQLGRGHTPDAVAGAVVEWLLVIVDWRDAGVPSGTLGPTGLALLRDAIRIAVDAVELGRRPPVVRRAGTPRPVIPRRDDEPLSLPPDPADER